MNRTLVLGDIHGGLRALKQVLERCNYDASKDKLIFLGDYVDGWSESSELIQFLIELELSATIKPVFLRGNHDKWCQDWLIRGHTNMIWYNQGGKSTMESYIRTSLLTEDSHRDFFKNLLNFYVDEDNRGFVHGGFVSRKGLGHDAQQSDYYWDRDMWQLAVLLHGRGHEAQGNNKALRFKKHKEVYIGHTDTMNWDVKPHYNEYNQPDQPKNGGIIVPMNRCNVWNMDTGAGFKGKLTIMDIDNKQYWQSDLLTELYPDEHGR